MWAYFARDNVGLINIAQFFKQESADERSHAQQLIEYQILRGGIVELESLPKPQLEYPGSEDMTDAMTAFVAALELEKTVNAALMDLHKLSENHNDITFAGFLESNFLAHQLESQRELALVISKLERIGKDPQAILAFDNDLMKANH